MTQLSFIARTTAGRCRRVEAILDAPVQPQIRTGRPKASALGSADCARRWAEGSPPSQVEIAVLWVLSESDGSKDLVAIAERSQFPYADIVRAACALEKVGLLRAVD